MTRIYDTLTDARRIAQRNAARTGRSYAVVGEDGNYGVVEAYTARRDGYDIVEVVEP